MKMIKRLLILKGEPNSGKSSTLKILRKMLLAGEQDRKINYQDLWIWVISMSIHESSNWEQRIEQLIYSEADIIIIPVWSDSFIHKSRYGMFERLEDVVNRRAKKSFVIDIYETYKYEKLKDQIADQQRIANEMMDYIKALARVRKKYRKHL